jgi:DNA-binding CsgD family transcriptional regulator
MVDAFVGRERELEKIRESLEQALQGDGSLVLVSGEAGIGKTSLVQALAEEAKERDALVLNGAAYDLSATPPYGPWLDLTDCYPDKPDLPELPEILKRGTGIGDLQSQLELFQFVRDFFVQVSDVRPLILVLEDLHWSDQASLDLLRYLARRIDDQRLLIIGTYRNDEIARHHPLFQLLPSLARESRSLRIELSPLNPEAVSALVGIRWSLEPDDEARLIEYLLSHAEGHPLFTVELLHTLEQHAFVSPEENGWKLADLSQVLVPSLVQQLIERRLLDLSDNTRQYLEVASVIGHDVPLDLWQSVAEMTDEQLVEVVEQATETHFLMELPDGEGWCFSHALVREVLYEGIALMSRRRWHQLIGQALAYVPHSDPDAVAHHFQMARDGRAVEWLIRATNRAEMAYAFGTAAERLETAIQILEGSLDRQRQRGWLIYRLGMMNRWINPERGAACLDEAQNIADQVGDRLLGAISRSFHGILLCFSGQVQQGLAGMKAAAIAYDELSPHERQQPRWGDEDSAYGPAPELVWPAINPIKGTYTLWLSFVGRYEEALSLGEQFIAEALATKLGQQLSSGRANGISGVGASDNVAIHAAQLACAYAGTAEALAMFGMPHKASASYATARDIFDSINHHVMVSNSAAEELLNVVLPYAGDDHVFRERLANDGEEAWTKAQGAMRGDLSPRIVRLPFLVIEGKWTEACDLARDFKRNYGNVAMHMKARVVIGSIARCRGDSAAAWEQVHEGLSEGPESEPGDYLFTSTITLLRLAAALALDEARIELARQWLRAHDHWISWSGSVPGHADGHALWGRLLLAEGDVEMAFDHAQRALSTASNPRQPLALVSVHRLHGELYLQSDDHAAAEHHLQQSLGLAHACAAPFERALTMLAQAKLELARDNQDGARPLLTEVREICSDLGAHPTLERAEQLLTELEPRRVANPSGLTERELEVLQLLVQGKSDRDIADELFISYRTVTNHVANILRKLNVDSRTAAATQAVREELV